MCCPMLPQQAMAAFACLKCSEKPHCCTAQIDNGVEGLIIGGTTGEGQLMSWDEHIMLIAHTVNRWGRR